MSAHHILVNDVQTSKNKVLCLARIDNYRTMLKHISVGESIRTEPIQLNFNKSIGTSNWILIFYPKGQYIQTPNSSILESGRASMYLKLLNCDNHNESLAMTIKFFIKSPYCDVDDEFSSIKCATFSYRNRNECWIGPFDLAVVEELHSQRCKKLFLNDSLTIGCELNDTTSRTSSSLNWWNWTPSDDVRRSHAEVGIAKNVNGHVKDSVESILSYGGTSRTRSKHSVNITPKVGVKMNVVVKANDQKTMPSQRFSSSEIREKKLRDNEKEKFSCTCGRSNKKISRETQTWSEILLHSCSEKMDSKKSESDAEAKKNVHRSSYRDRDNGCRVRSVIDFFEKCSISRD